MDGGAGRAAVGGIGAPAPHAAAGARVGYPRALRRRRCRPRAGTNDRERNR